MNIEPVSRSAQVLKPQVGDIRLVGKNIAEHVRQLHSLDREERAAWRFGQKIQADKKRRSDEIQMDLVNTGEKKRADEIYIQMAQTDADREQTKIHADKELALREIELKAQAETSTSVTVDLPPRNRDAKSLKLPAFIDEKDELDS